jgi:DNA-binding response OmpR family regulator
MNEKLSTEALVMVAPQTILVIDDDPDICGHLQMILEDSGFRVITAGDGQTGLTRASHDRPNLVIVDMMMPKMSGFVVLERLKQRQGMPVIMLTANGSEQQRAFAEFLGVDAYLTKPAGTKIILDHVRQLCPPESNLATVAQSETVA